jgi:hypothetical protein
MINFAFGKDMENINSCISSFSRVYSAVAYVSYDIVLLHLLLFIYSDFT